MFELNGIEWDVQFVHPLHPTMFRSDNSLSIGACDNNSKTIYLNRALHDSQLKKVLTHEITHAAMFSYGVNLTSDQEELLSDLLATYGDEIIYTANKVFRKIKNGN